MANTSVVYARIDTEMKERAEKILMQLGLSPSSAIQMLYSQIILTHGIPFEVRLPERVPVAIGDMSRESLNAEIQKGLDSVAADRVYSSQEVDALLAKEFGI